VRLTSYHTMNALEIVGKILASIINAAWKILDLLWCDGREGTFPWGQLVGWFPCWYY
jgi:hypothetical protein